MNNNNIFFTGEHTLNNNQMKYYTNIRLFSVFSPTSICFSCSDNKLTMVTIYRIGNTSKTEINTLDYYRHENSGEWKIKGTLNIVGNRLVLNGKLNIDGLMDGGYSKLCL